MRYQVGDKLIVREDLEEDEYYDGIFFNTDMYKAWRGKEVTISRVSNIFYEVIENEWVWSESMFELPIPPDWDGVDLGLFFGGTQ